MMDWNKVCDTLAADIREYEARLPKMESETGRYGIAMTIAVLKPLERALRAGLAA